MKKVLLSTIILATVLTSCQKQPEADFNFSKETVNPEEKVSCKNTSLNADHYKWVLNDGQTSTSKDLDITPESPGTYSVTLKAYSKRDKKIDQVTKSFKVNGYNSLYVGTYTGNVNTGCEISNMTVTINGEDKINMNFDGDVIIGKVTSATSGTLEPYYDSDSSSSMTVTGSFTKSGNTITVNLSFNYIDYNNSSNSGTWTCSSNLTKS